MKILLLTQVLPYPPDSGPKVKTWNVLKNLARQHEVTLISFIRGNKDTAVHHLRDLCQEVYTVPMKRGRLRDLWAMAVSLSSGDPFLMVRDDRRQMRRMVEWVIKESTFDLVHADQLNMAQYALRVPSARRVLDTHNALWLLYKRLWETMNEGLQKRLLGRDWRLLKRYEGEMCRSFNIVLSVSAEDKAALEEAIGEPRDIKVIPIGVDLKELPFIERAESAKHVLHVGTMYWPPNIDGILWFLREVWPLLQDRRPDIKLDIVGSKPPPEVVYSAKDNKEINVAGYVENLEPYLLRAGVMIVPLRAGGGMRVKILNALAQGIPVVTTSIGYEGIACVSGKHLLVADSPEDFAEATLQIIEDRQLAHKLARQGQELIQSHYSYQSVCKGLSLAYGPSSVRGDERR